jgi:hypothetical protein
MESTRCSCQILIKHEFFTDFLKEISNIKYHENLSRVSRLVPCGQMDGGRNRQAKLRVAFHGFVNSPYGVKIQPEYTEISSATIAIYTSSDKPAMKEQLAAGNGLDTRCRHCFTENR